MPMYSCWVEKLLEQIGGLWGRDGIRTVNIPMMATDSFLLHSMSLASHCLLGHRSPSEPGHIMSSKVEKLMIPSADMHLNIPCHVGGASRLGFEHKA